MTVTVPYITVDVFTETPFGGNPLAVIPDARGLSDVHMQQIAREFNYSETTFVLPARIPGNTAQVRIFTPTCEVPFAGHPNVGTAFVLGQEGWVFGQAVGEMMRFEESAGLVDVRLLRERDAIIGAEIKIPRGLTIDHIIEPSVIADCASLDISEIVTVHHEPVMASVGLPFAIAEVSGLESLAKAHPDTSAFTNADRRYPHNDIRLRGYRMHRPRFGRVCLRHSIMCPKIPQREARQQLSRPIWYRCSRKPMCARVLLWNKVWKWDGQV